VAIQVLGVPEQEATLKANSGVISTIVPVEVKKKVGQNTVFVEEHPDQTAKTRRKQVKNHE